MAQAPARPAASAAFAAEQRAATRSKGGSGALTAEGFWAAIFVVPYVVVFLLFVIYPVLYGFWLGSNPADYLTLIRDPIFVRTVLNTFIFIIVGVNIKMFLALMLSGYFNQHFKWVKWI